MGLSMMTVMAIAHNETIRVEVGGPNAEGKFAGFIMIDDNHRILVSTPGMFDSHDDAKAQMDGVVTDCKTWCAGNRDKIEALL